MRPSGSTLPCPGISTCCTAFDQIVEGSSIHGNHSALLRRILPLRHELSDERDALTFPTLRSRSVSLVHKHTEVSLRMDFQQIEVLAVWTLLQNPVYRVRSGSLILPCIWNKPRPDHPN